MERRENMDTFGTSTLVMFALLLAFNQVLIKVVNDGFQPIFLAGIRSVVSGTIVIGWIWFRGRSLDFRRRDLWPGLMLGAIFASEFLFLFTALDLTSVIRTSIMFYTMPVWLAIGAHFLLPAERISATKAIGLALAFAGMVWAMLDRGQGAGDANIWGDLLALGAAIAWAGIPLSVRLTSLSKLRPEMQLLWQLTVSAPILLFAALFLGPFVRDLQMIHLMGFGLLALIASGGFMFWLWLLTIYPASGVASFSFLSPIFGIALGWLLLGETASPTLIGSGILVAFGLLLINRRGAGHRAD